MLLFFLNREKRKMLNQGILVCFLLVGLCHLVATQSGEDLSKHKEEEDSNFPNQTRKGKGRNNIFQNKIISLSLLFNIIYHTEMMKTLCSKPNNFASLNRFQFVCVCIFLIKIEYLFIFQFFPYFLWFSLKILLAVLQSKLYLISIYSSILYWTHINQLIIQSIAL